jgi:hypothetical protein
MESAYVLVVAGAGLAGVGLVNRLLPLQTKRYPNAHPGVIQSWAMGPAIARWLFRIAAIVGGIGLVWLVVAWILG